MGLKFLATVALVSCSTTATTPGDVDENDLFGVMGQSNAAAPAGAANGDPEYAESLVGSDNVLTWDGSAFVRADPDTSTDANPNTPAERVSAQGIGQWAGKFGLEATANGPRAAVRFVTSVEGGAFITRFLPGSARWDEFMEKVQAAQKPLTHFVWWQGEANSSVDAVTLEGHLDTLYTSLHNVFPCLRGIFAFQIAEGACGQDQTTSRLALSNWAAKNADVTLISLDDLTGNSTYTDGCHLRREGYLVAGARLYAAVHP